MPFLIHLSGLCVCVPGTTDYGELLLLIVVVVVVVDYELLLLLLFLFV